MTAEGMDPLIADEEKQLRELMYGKDGKSGALGIVSQHLITCAMQDKDCPNCSAQKRADAYMSENAKLEDIQRTLLKSVAQDNNLQIEKELKGRIGNTMFDFSNYATGNDDINKENARNGKNDPCFNRKHRAHTTTASAAAAPAATAPATGGQSTVIPKPSAAHRVVASASKPGDDVIKQMFAKPGSQDFPNGCKATLEVVSASGNSFNVTLTPAVVNEQSQAIPMLNQSPDQARSALSGFYKKCSSIPVTKAQTQPASAPTGGADTKIPAEAKAKYDPGFMKALEEMGKRPATSAPEAFINGCRVDMQSDQDKVSHLYLFKSNNSGTTPDKADISSDPITTTAASLDLLQKWYFEQCGGTRAPAAASPK